MSTKEDGCRVCIAAIRLEDVAALQLAQPSLGEMAVKEPAQPFWCYIPRLADTGWHGTNTNTNTGKKESNGHPQERKGDRDIFETQPEITTLTITDTVIHSNLKTEQP